MPRPCHGKGMAMAMPMAKGIAIAVTRPPGLAKALAVTIAKNKSGAMAAFTAPSLIACCFRLLFFETYAPLF